jgi:hypothetical protein
MSALQDTLKAGTVDAADVAYVLATTPRSVARWQHDGTDPGRRKLLDRLLELKAVTDLALQVLPAGSAWTWLHSPIPALGYEKPLELIRYGEFRRVVGSLTALAEGAA